MHLPPSLPPQAPEEQFAAFSETLSPGDVLSPGSRALIKSAKTGMFCRVVQAQGSSHIQCDVTDPAQASRFVYTGSGFSYNGGWPQQECCSLSRQAHFKRTSRTQWQPQPC